MVSGHDLLCRESWRNEMKHVCLIHPICCCLFSIAACAQTAGNNWSNRISSEVTHPIKSLINPHINPISVLIVDEQRFEHVRGAKTFYLQVPNTNCIVFVTEGSSNALTYHFYNMDTRVDVAIHSQSSMSSFGETIGAPKPCESVSIGTNGVLVLCYLMKDAKSTLPSLAALDSVKDFYYLDIQKKTILANRTVYYNKAGDVIYERNANPPF